jgi:hypothetical protein
MRLWKKIALILAGLLVLSCIAGYVYLFPLNGLSGIVNSRIKGLIERQHQLRVDIGRIDGTLITGLCMHDISVMYVDSGRQYQMAYIPRLEASYFLSTLLSGDYSFDEIILDSARVCLRQDERGRWLLPDFSPDSSAGESLGLPEVSVGRLAIRDAGLVLLRRNDTLRFDSVRLLASLRVEGHTYSADIKELGIVSDREVLRLDDAQGQVTFSGGELYGQDLNILRADNRLRLSGMLDMDRTAGRIVVDADNLDLRDLHELLGVRLRGVLDVNGTVAFDRDGVYGMINAGGEFMDVDVENLTISYTYADKRLSLDTLYGSLMEGCAVDGSGGIDFSGPVETYRLEAAVKNFGLDNLIKNGFYSDLTGFVRLRGSSFSSDELQMTVSMELRESAFDEYSFHGASGEMLITSDSIVFVDPFLFTYYENRFSTAGVVAYSGGTDLRVTAELDNLDRYRGKLFIDKPGGRGRAEAVLSGATSDPDLRGSFHSDSVWIYGLFADSMSVEFDVSRFLTGKRGRVEIVCFDGSAWSFPYDTGYAMLTLDSNIVFIDSINVSAEQAAVWSHGSLDHGAYPQRLALDSLSLQVFDQWLFNRDEILVDVDSSGFNFLEVEIGRADADLSVSGRADYDETMSLSLNARNIRLAPWLTLFERESPLDGNLSANAHLAGSFEEPVFSLIGSIDSLQYVDTQLQRNGEFFLGDLSASMQYGERVLTIDSLLVNSGSGVYQAKGYLPVNLAFSTGPLDRLPDEPFDIAITASDSRFDLVSLFLPSVEQLDGHLRADIRLTGTASDPHLDGYAYLKDARLKYFDLRGLIHADSAGIMMRDNNIIINRMEAYVLDWRSDDDTSYVQIVGDITVKSLDNFVYDLDVSIEKELAFIYELEDIQGVVEGELSIRGETPPTVTGDLTVLSLIYRVPFADEDEGSPVMMALSGEDTWDLNLDIDILSNFGIKNEDIDALFSGFITLMREDGVSRFLGELEILRGKGYFLDKTFRIESGSNVVFQDIETLNPELDIRAHTRIAGVSFFDDPERETLDLCLHVGGTLDEPEIEPCEGSPFDRQDLPGLLLANYFSSDSIQTSSAFGERFSQLVGAQVSQIATRHLGVETIEIDPAYEGELDLYNTSVTLGFYTAPNLYVYGRSAPLAGQYGQEVGFEYRFNKSFLLEGRRSEEEEYILNLKLRLEF